ncbi:MAG: cytochrome c5 family protein [Gammaproteobacteria bacterium]|nr:cytochrome c5 family protein [Gammaproteobacteria bacterium]
MVVGVALSGQALASKLADQTGNAEPMGTRSIMSPTKIDARTQPSAKVCVQGEECGGAAAAPVVAAAAAAKSPEEIYNSSCMACHATGAAGAPKVGDAAAWAPRIAQGADLLHKHAIGGLNMMPPKGTCAACSDDEIMAVVDFMVSKSK